jgi:PAS domain S-box-containing protein
LKKHNQISKSEIRKKAENQMKNRIPKVDSAAMDDDMRGLVHELQVHQIELEMQNEELVIAREQIAAASSEKYKELYDFAPTAYFTISKTGHIRELNLKGADMLGSERQKLINLKFNKFIPPTANLIFDDFLQTVFTQKSTETCEINLSPNPRSQYFVFITGQVIDGGEQCLLSIIDITQRIKAEVELKNKMDELKIVNKQLEEYSFHNQELKQFANISSHELQQPIRTIYNYIQIYESEYASAMDEKSYRYLNIIKDSAKRMYALIHSLSDYSKVGMSKTLRLLNFKEVIDNVISDLDAAIKLTGAEIHISEMPVIYAYEVEIHQLFLNLISNAIKFHNKDIKPVIKVDSERTGGFWKFSVSDNGIGISETDYGKLFKMFQRLHSDEDEFEGKGIGLTVCKKIVELHKGNIWIESNGGPGATFYFTIATLTTESAN